MFIVCAMIFVSTVAEGHELTECVLADSNLCLSDGQRDALMHFWKACNNIIDRVVGLEVDGCWHLLKIHETGVINAAEVAQFDLSGTNLKAVKAAANSLVAWAAQFDDKVGEAKSTGTNKRRRERIVWVAEAMLLVQEHPGWTDAKIATHVGKHKSSLSRSPEYQRAAEIARGKKEDRHDGYIRVDSDSGLTSVEAYSIDMHTDESG